MIHPGYCATGTVLYQTQIVRNEPKQYHWLLVLETSKKCFLAARAIGYRGIKIELKDAYFERAQNISTLGITRLLQKQVIGFEVVTTISPEVIANYREVVMGPECAWNTMAKLKLTD